MREPLGASLQPSGAWYGWSQRFGELQALTRDSRGLGWRASPGMNMLCDLEQRFVTSGFWVAPSVRLVIPLTYQIHTVVGRIRDLLGSV